MYVGFAPSRTKQAHSKVNACSAMHSLDIDNMLRTSVDEEEGYNMVPPSVLRPLNAMREQIASTEMNDQYKVWPLLLFVGSSSSLLNMLSYNTGDARTSWHLRSHGRCRGASTSS